MTPSTYQQQFTLDLGTDLKIHATYRRLRVLSAIAALPGANNGEVADEAGIKDGGQISKLLWRLEGLGLIELDGGPPPSGEPNAWTLTALGAQVRERLLELNPPPRRLNGSRPI